MRLNQLKSVVAPWRRKKLRAIKFSETTDRANEPYPDYNIVYECSFEPKKLDRGRIEFWLTDDGYVAVGVERYARICKRTGLQTASPKRFAAGAEPHEISKEALQILLKAVAQGRMLFVVKSFFGIVTSVKLYLRSSDYEALVMAGYHPNWMSEMSDDVQYPPVWWGNALRFEPWLGG